MVTNSMDSPEWQVSQGVVELLWAQRYPLVIWRGSKAGPGNASKFVGRGEFTFKPPGLGYSRKVDIVAARWVDDEPYVVAVESKATAKAIFDALGQAVQYQTVFDEVYIATPEDINGDPTARSALADLGVGYIRTNLETKRAHIMMEPQRRPMRLLADLKAYTVDLRLALGLVLSSIQGAQDAPVFYGSGQTGLFTWFAQKVNGKSKGKLGELQWNSRLLNNRP